MYSWFCSPDYSVPSFLRKGVPFIWSLLSLQAVIFVAHPLTSWSYPALWCVFIFTLGVILLLFFPEISVSLFPACSFLGSYYQLKDTIMLLLRNCWPSKDFRRSYCLKDMWNHKKFKLTTCWFRAGLHSDRSNGHFKNDFWISFILRM